MPGFAARFNIESRKSGTRSIFHIWIGRSAGDANSWRLRRPN